MCSISFDVLLDLCCCKLRLCDMILISSFSSSFFSWIPDWGQMTGGNRRVHDGAGLADNHAPNVATVVGERTCNRGHGGLNGPGRDLGHHWENQTHQ